MSHRYFLSPRSETTIKSENGSKNLQQLILEKDKQISQLQSNINKLELKNKQFSSFQAILAETQAKVSQLQKENFHLKQNSRQQMMRQENLIGKCKQLEQANKNLKQTAGSFVRKQQYERLKDELKKVKQSANFQQITRIQCQMQERIRFEQKQYQKVASEKNELLRAINTKNQEIVSLRSAVSSYQSHTGDQSLSLKQLTDEINRLNLQLHDVNTEKDQYKSKTQTLEHRLQQYVHTSSQWSTHNKNNEYLDKIQQYQQHIQAMASKLSSIHHLQMERNKIDKLRQEYQVQCESLKSDNNALKHYIEQLEQKIRKIEEYGSQYLEIDMQRFQSNNRDFTAQLEIFFSKLGEKQQDLSSLHHQFLKMSESFNQQFLVNVDNTLNNLEQDLLATKDRLCQEQQKIYRQQEKYMKLQKQVKSKEVQYNQIKSQLGKLNRTLSQKMQKIEFQAMQIKRLQNENRQKLELSEKLAKLQKKIVGLQNDLDSRIDQNNQFLMTILVMGTEISRLNAQDKVSPQLVAEIQSLNEKAKQNENYAKIIQERINRLEYLHKCVYDQSVKTSEHLHASHKRWNHYDLAMQQITNFLEQANENSERVYNEIDENIAKSIQKQEESLAEIRRKDQEQFKKMIDAQEKIRVSNIEAEMIAKFQAEHQPQRIVLDNNQLVHQASTEKSGTSRISTQPNQQ